jgi:hypothetical protein
MPSFYPRQNMPRQLLTPPEFVPSYHQSCGGMQYQQQNAYAGQPAIRPQDDGYDFADRYGQLAIAMPPMYPQAGTYLSNAPPSLPPPSSFYEPTGAAILPPMRVPQGHSMADAQRAHEYSQCTQPPVKEEKPVGGVSAKLDYDMDVMTDFVCETALRLITPGRMAPTSFRKWVHQVLCATRLPSATILLSMFYLGKRMPMLYAEPKTDTHLFRLLTIALVMGSKFLDDNTFINRSWSEVSGIRVDELRWSGLTRSTTSCTAILSSTRAGSTGPSNGRSSKTTLLLALAEATSLAPSTPRCTVAHSTPTSRFRHCPCSSRSIHHMTTLPSLRSPLRHRSTFPATLSTILGGLSIRLRLHPLLDPRRQSTMAPPERGARPRATRVAPCSGSLRCLSLLLSPSNTSLPTTAYLHTHPSTTRPSGTSTVSTVVASTVHSDMRPTSWLLDTDLKLSQSKSCCLF